MSKSKIKKKVQNNLKLFHSAPEQLIGKTKNKIENFFKDLKKNKEKRKLRLEKEKKIQEKKEIQQKKSKLKRIS